MKVAKFSPTGGTLSVEITCVPPRDGSYEIRLWHRDLNKKMREWPGNFHNADDDRYDLPNAPRINDGRALQALAVVAIPGSVSPSTLTLVVRQAETELASEERLVPPGSVDQTVQLWIVLEVEE